jgi:hypothetical protein
MTYEVCEYSIELGGEIYYTLCVGKDLEEYFITCFVFKYKIPPFVSINEGKA